MMADQGQKGDAKGNELNELRNKNQALENKIRALEKENSSLKGENFFFNFLMAASCIVGSYASFIL